MGKYGEIIEDFYTERTRIVDALAQDENKHILMRLIGALAFRTHCPQYGYIQDKLGRKFTDFDFVSYPRFVRDIRRVLTELGYEEDRQVTQLFGDRRMVFHDPAFGRHIDVFYNVLDYCHPINFVGRLEKEQVTIPLAELLMEKMQIVQINEKDLIDSIMLLREHPIGNSDHETINAVIIVGILSKDWGFWRTMTANLKLLDDKLAAYASLTDEDRQVVHGRIKELRDRIDAAPKSLAWKARAQIGDRVKWYKDVEELQR
ncbi:MAG TPA: hypothetical protein VMJ64_13095 [Anaerolineales bacterium]|nr:hypothetical protein [Anaerolineales bacterium]